MKSDAGETARQYFAASGHVIDVARADAAFMATLVKIADAWTQALRRGGKIMLAGNGGSAGDAQHIAGELLSRLNFDRPALAAVALTTDTSVLTAVGNDYGFERVFERQVLGLGRPGDVFVGISTSAQSPNVVRALAAARRAELTTIGFTGKSGGSMAELCDLCLCAPSSTTPLIQQVHIAAAHVICGLVEDELFGSAYAGAAGVKTGGE
jgi:D-sedoheptulose 7-phosphate isomerase